MEENNNTTFFTFDSPKGQSSYIKVIGVGGGGGNAVNHMFKQGIEGVDFIVCNTDLKALNASPVPNKILLGNGLGAGGKAERARLAAEAKADDIREALSHNTKMLFITAGMGGGTGTGAAPVIAEIAKSIELEDGENKNILVVAIVTRPFSFEGRNRCGQAEAGIDELRKHVDSMIVINNDKLRSFGNMGISAFFGMADDVLLTAAKGIAEIITKNAYVNRDFQDVNSVMEHSGKALMGTGSGKGETRAHDAIEAATTSVLLDDSDISGAKNVMLYFTYSPEYEMTGDEMTEITDFVLDRTNGTADIIWGAGPDETLGDELKVILIATGFEKSAEVEEAPVVITLDEPKQDDTPKPEPKDEKANEPDEDGMRIIKHDTPLDEQTTVAEPAKPEVFNPDVELVRQQSQSQPQPQPTNVGPVVTAAPLVAPAPAAPAPEQEQKPVKRVIPLDDDEPTLTEARTVAQRQVEEAAAKVDTMVDDIHVVPVIEKAKPEPRPEAKPAPAAPADNVMSKVFRNDNDAKTAIDRIQYIHDLLRSNPNGAEIVQQIRSEEALYEGTHSSSREASGYTMRADGTTAQAPYLYRNQPD